MAGYYNFISVIVPCLNSEKSIEKCVGSLLQQDYPVEYFEIIFIDNGSIDTTLKLISKYPVKVMNETVRNPYAARNKGALSSKGNILAFTDSNCDVDINWLKSINECINYGADVTQGPGNLTKQTSLIARAESYRLNMTQNQFWGDAKNLAIKKDIFLSMNGFFHYYTGADSLMLNKLKSRNYKITYNEKQIVYKEFSEKYLVLLKKSWKYGKGDLINDYFNNDLNRMKRVKRIIKLPVKIIVKSIKFRTFEAYFIENLYFNTIQFVRHCSYVINYRKVLKNCIELK